jgi:intracellular multiplication protein IcmV
MAIRDIFKVSFRTYFNPKAWVGVTNIKATTGVIWGVTKNLFNAPKPAHVETFENAIQRLHLKEEDLEKSQKHFLTYAVVFVILAGFTFATSFYMAMAYHTFFGWLFSILATLLFLSQALRFHFWYFQIKHRKLGCTFAEWWHGKPNPKGKTS